MANADHPAEPTGRPTIPQRTMGPIDTEMAKRQEAATRKSIIKSGVRTEARRLHYMDVEPTRGMEHVLMQASTIEKMAAIFIDRREAIISLANKGADVHDPLDSMVKQSAGKWEKWAAYFQGGAAPAEADKFTKEDLDVAYYVLFDTIAQLSINQGLNVNAQSRFFGLLEPSVRIEPTSPSYTRQSGWATEFTRIRASRLKDRNQNIDDLTGFENTRREFIKSLTGHNLNDRVMNRVNWGACTDSVLLRGRTGLKLHDKIIEIFEGSQGYQGLLREFNNRNPGRNLQTITDLLVNLDNPQDRSTFINLFHEALGKATIERFADKGAEFAKTNLEDIKEKSWQPAHLVENAETVIKVLESEGRLNAERTTEFNEFKTGFQNIKDLLVGGGNPAIPSLDARITSLRDAISRHRDILTDPENNLVPIRADLTASRLRLAAYITGAPPVPIPGDIAALDGQIAGIPGRIAAIPPVGGAYPIEQRQADIESINRELTQLQTERTNLITKHKESEERRIQDLQTRLTAANTARNPAHVEANQASLVQSYEFVQNELPRSILGMRDLRDRLNRLIVPVPPPGGGAPPPVAPDIVPHTARIAQQVARLNGMITYLENMQNGVGANSVRRGPAESWEDYTAAGRFNFVLNQNNVHDYAQQLEEEMKAIDELLNGRRLPGTDDRIRGIKLEIALAKGLDAVTESAGPPRVAARAAVSRVLDKSIEGVFTPTGGERIARLRRNDLPFGERVGVIRAMLLDHPELINDPDLRSTDLWRRVFNDEFILQKAIEFCSEFPLPAAPLGDLLAGPPNQFTENLIEHLGEFEPYRMAEFMTYLVGRRLNDIGSSDPIPANIREASLAGVRGAVNYGAVPATTYGARVFSSEVMVDFNTEIRRKRNLGMRASRSWNVENVGRVREVYDSRITTINGRQIRVGQELDVEFPESNPLVIHNAAGQRFELPLRVNINKRRGVGSLEIWLQANDTLRGLGGLGIPGLENNYDKRWVNLTPARMRVAGVNINNMIDLNNALQNVMPGFDPGAMTYLTYSISRTLGDYFLGLPAGVARARFPRFQAQNIPAAFGNLIAAGYDWISMDASGNIELRRGVGGEIVSVNSVLETTNQNTIIDDIFGLVGSQVINVMGS